MDSAGPSDTWSVLHERFHEELYALANLPRLSQMIIGLRGQMRPYAKLYSDDPEQVRHVQAEHYTLLKALRTRDEASIKRILHEHLSRPARLALSKLGAAEEMTADFSGA
jgi:DNA-binding GntR family transcriptional regulator